jgi:lysophospholipase L1-like esterase
MKQRTIIAAATLLLAWTTFHSAVLAGEGEFGSAEPFKEGDTVCFVGDSITRGGNYLSYIRLFYATRFPGRKIQFWNCGVGGDTSANIVTNEAFRVKGDILSHHPKVATIMLGMNDIGHRDYGPEQSGPEVEKRRQHSLEVYDQNMRKLIASLQQSGARLILITPSIYDETTKLEKAKPNVGVGRSAALAICSNKVHEWAAEYHTGLVKFQEEMNAVTIRGQAKDPAFTIVGPDRVHPGAVGHMIMAHTFLKAQGMPREIARVAVDARKAAAADVSNCEITDVKATATGVEFDCLEKALPFVPVQEVQPAFALVPFEQELNQEPLVVSGLEAGRYELRIDGNPVGEYSAVDFQKGINLAQNERTPQHRQSAAAAKVNYELTQAVGHLRVVAEQYYTLFRQKVDLADRAAVEKGLAGRFAEEKAAGKTVDPIALQLLNDPQTPSKLENKLNELTIALEQSCRPRKHHYAIVKRS